MVHIADTKMQGFQEIPVHTVATGVVVLAVPVVQKLKNLEVWIGFGTEKDFHCVPAHDISSSLGLRKSLALSYFMPLWDVIPCLDLHQWERSLQGI